MYGGVDLEEYAGGWCGCGKRRMYVGVDLEEYAGGCTPKEWCSCGRGGCMGGCMSEGIHVARVEVEFVH